MTTVLVTDPDRHQRRRLAAALRYAGYIVETAPAQRQAAFALRRSAIGAVILDPADANPVDSVAAIRAQTAAPIIVIAGPGEEAVKVAVLDAGADDYLTTPVGLDELLARLRVALRRIPEADPVEEPIATPDFAIHVRDRRWVRRDGTEVRLTPIEWRLVEMLVAHPGRLVSQHELLLGVWGPYAVDRSNYLRVQLAAIRRKVEPDPAHPRYFITAPGLGLRFQPAVRC